MNERIQSFVASRKAQLFQQLEEVVNVNSHTGNLPGCLQMLDWFEGHFKESGLTEGGRVAGLEDRPHVILNNGVETGPRVLMVGHVDTVFPIDNPFQTYEERGETIHGPGVSDMKGGLLLAAATCAGLRELGLLDQLHISLFLSTDEETQSRTSKQLLLDHCATGFDMALIFEGGRKNGNLVYARKGVGRYLVTVEGKSAHAGISHKDGVNAIEGLASKVLAIQKLTDYDRGVTLNAGRTAGGVSRNTVAPTAWAEFDLRVEHAEDAPRVDAAIREICETEQLPGSRTLLEGGLGRPPWPENDGSHALAAHWVETAAALGMEIAGQPTGGGSDGNFTAAAGIPSLDALGPVGGNPHTPEEYIERTGMTDRLYLNLVALSRWINEGKSL